MSEKPKKKKIAWQQYIVAEFYALIGLVCGIFMVKYMNTALAPDSSLGEEILFLAALIIVLYIVIFLQMLIHEAGHLIFGLLTGYKFCSFRIMSFMWIKQNGKIKFKRLSLAGTGGQCLMVPPEMIDGKLPVVLYNLGGSIMNIIAGVICFGLYFLFANIPILSMIMMMLTVIGLAFALMNGVPMRMGLIDNDGYNALSLGKNANALRAFWVQFKINEQLSNGIRLKDMPQEWFTVPADHEMKNSLIAATGVFACNRLMDEQRFDEADKLMAHLLETDSSIVGLHRNLMICDRMYCEMISSNRQDVLEHMLTKEQQKFMQSMKNYPSVLRTQYVYALLSENDTAKAETIKTQFEKQAKTYPYPADVQSEWELMETASKKAIIVNN